MYMDAKKWLDHCQWSLWTPEWKEIDWKGTGCTWHCVCVCVCVCLSVCAHVCMHVHTHLVALSWVVVAPTLCDPMDCSPPGSFVHGISQVKMLEWVTILFSRGSNLDLWHCRWIFLTIWATVQYCEVRRCNSSNGLFILGKGGRRDWHGFNDQWPWQKSLLSSVYFLQQSYRCPLQ